MTEFKKGDRVIIVGHWLSRLNGKEGIILEQDENDFYPVEFDEYIEGHSCNDMCENGKGRYVHRNNLELDVWSMSFYTKCETESEAKHFIKECYERGIVWSSQAFSNEKLIDRTYFTGQPTCYFVDNGKITYGDDEFVFGKKFIRFKKLFPSHTSLTRTYYGDSCPLAQTQDIEKVIINDPCIIVFLKSGEKGIAKCMPEDAFDEQIGYEIAYCKAKIKALSNNIKSLNMKLSSYVNH